MYALSPTDCQCCRCWQLLRPSPGRQKAGSTLSASLRGCGTSSGEGLLQDQRSILSVSSSLHVQIAVQSYKCTGHYHRLCNHLYIYMYMYMYVIYARTLIFTYQLLPPISLQCQVLPRLEIAQCCSGCVLGYVRSTHAHLPTSRGTYMYN